VGNDLDGRRKNVAAMVRFGVSAPPIEQKWSKMKGSNANWLNLQDAQKIKKRAWSLIRNVPRFGRSILLWQ
jgi:hypothetical protein